MKNHAIFCYKNYKNIAMTCHDLPFFKVNIKIPPSLPVQILRSVFNGGKTNPNKYPMTQSLCLPLPHEYSKLIKYLYIS